MSLEEKLAFNLVEAEEGKGFKLMKDGEEISSAPVKEELIDQLTDEFGEEYEIVEPEEPKEPEEGEVILPKEPEEAEEPEEVKEPGPSVPVAALTDERNKRQAYESVVKEQMDTLKAEIETLKNPPTAQEPMDPYGGLDPDESISVRDFSQAITKITENFTNQMNVLTGVQQADVLMEQLRQGPEVEGLGMTVKEIIETAAPILNANPQVKAQLATTENPLYELYVVANARRMQDVFGGNTAAPNSGDVTKSQPSPTNANEVTEATAKRTADALNNQKNLSPSQGDTGDAQGDLGGPIDAAMVRLAQFAGQSREAYHAELLRLKKDEPATFLAIEVAMGEEEV